MTIQASSVESPAQETLTSSAHAQKVAAIVAQLTQASTQGLPLKKGKAGVEHVVPNAYRDSQRAVRLDLSALTEILEIDTKRRVAVVESGVSFERLARATLEHGLMPCCVPELKGITVGGAVAGCSVESLSYRYGGFHDSCLEYEVITGMGEVVTCSPAVEPELFHMVHGSYGTLAALTRVTCRLIEARPYVHMTYIKHSTFGAFRDALLRACQDGSVDFIDGIIHARDCFVLCLGRLKDDAPFTSSYDRTGIFYLSTREKSEDYLATYDYFFRYDADCHWLTEPWPPLQWKPVRALLGKSLLGSTNLIRNSSRLRTFLSLQRRQDVVVDVFIPSSRFTDFFEWYERVMNFYPLWIVPYRIERPYPWVSDQQAARMGDSLMIDCAVYGKKNNDRLVDYSQLLEQKVQALGGIKTLISRNHYDQETFWSIYSRERYEAAKRRSDPSGLFGDLYQKFSPEASGAVKS